jgi:hypothetical protein
MEVVLKIRRNSGLTAQVIALKVLRIALILPASGQHHPPSHAIQTRLIPEMRQVEVLDALPSVANLTIRRRSDDEHEASEVSVCRSARVNRVT